MVKAEQTVNLALSFALILVIFALLLMLLTGINPKDIFDTFQNILTLIIFNFIESLRPVLR